MTETSDLTLLTPSFITDANGGVWSLASPSPKSGVQICYNGSIQTSTANVVLLLYFNHTVYHENTSNKWYAYKNGAWTASTDPRITESPAGTSVTTVGPTIIDSSLESWTLVSSPSSGLQIACNGTVDTSTQLVVLLYYTNHRLYQENSNGGWWYKSKSSDPWTATTDPRITPTPAPTPTPPAPTPTPVVHYGTTAPSSLPNVAGSTSPLGWTVGFFDDFLSFTPSSTGSTAATTATSQWTTVFPWGARWLGGQEEQILCDPSMGINPFSHSGSVLSITTRLPTGSEASLMQGQTYVSGGLFSYNFLKPTYGYFELNCELPTGAGFWPAFYMTEYPVVNPPGWEFDIFEMVDDPYGNPFGTGTWWTTLHWPNLAGTSIYSSNMGKQLVNTASSAFHTYGGLWTPKYFAWYLDGNLAFQVPYPTGNISAPGFSGLGGMFCYIYPAIGVSGSIAGTPDSTTKFPQNMNIDWFRYSALGPA